MLVDRKEFVESLSYMEITTPQLLDFIHASVDNLGPIDLWKNNYAHILAVHHPQKEQFAIQSYDPDSATTIVNSEDFLAISLKQLLEPFAH